MEESEPDPPARQACGMGGPAAVDVTLHHGVSTNTVPIGGRKRCREDDDQIDHKRRRSGKRAYGLDGLTCCTLRVAVVLNVFLPFTVKSLCLNENIMCLPAFCFERHI